MNKPTYLYAAPLALLLSTAFAAPPTSGDFVTDAQSQNVQDASTEALTTASEILCYMSNTRPDLMVNKGAYTALVDKSKCATGALSDASNSSQTATAGAVNYETFAMTTTRANNQSPQVGKGHVYWSGDGDGEISIPIFIHYSQSQAPSASAPNGALELMYAARMQEDMTLDSVQFSAGDIFMKGEISASGTSISFTETSDWGLPQQYVTRLFVDGDVNSGKGAVLATQWTNGGLVPKTYVFGYNETHFCRTDGTTEQCFFRAEDKAIKSVWRYGVYNADGSRFNAGLPGFSVRNADTGESGWASYWDIWMPSDVRGGESLVARDGTPYVVKKAGGRLVKYTKRSTTLDDIAYNRFNVWVSAQTQTIGGKQFVQNTSYEIYWDAVTDKFVVTGMQECDSNGCFLKRSSNRVGITAAQLDTLTSSWGVNAWSSSIGNLSISSAVLQNQNPGAFAQGVVLSENTVVLPGDSTVPATLKCVRDCIAPALLGGSPFLNNPDSNKPFTTGTAGKWADTAINDVVSYTWSSDSYELKLNGDEVTAALLDGIDDAKLKQSNFRWGIHGGILADGTGNNFSSGGAFDCDGSGNGTTMCEGVGMDNIDTYYRFETGLNNWNTSTFLTKSDGTYLQFSAPIKMSYIVPDEPSVYGEYSGAKMNLDYMGFGDLSGIPGRCISPDTNEEVSCDENTRWYPAFTLPDGAAITAPSGTPGGTTKYVKYLDRELRFQRDANATGASLGIAMGSLDSLPAAKVRDALADDPSNSASPVFAGSWDMNRFKAEPKVIHGELQ